MTYGLDLETAMDNLGSRVAQKDMALIVTATRIQTSTGGNLAEILKLHVESRAGKSEASHEGESPVG